jgi:hypothetical protein
MREKIKVRILKHASHNHSRYFCLDSFQAVDYFSTAKRSHQERPLATKILNRKKAYSWVVNRIVVTNVIFILDVNTLRESLAHIRTQSRRPCRAVQLGEIVLLNNPVSPI